jgi:hypothetical protein
MTSTIYDPFCSCIIIETYLADRAAITFVQNKPRLQTKVYLGIFSFAQPAYEWGSRIIYSLRIVWKNMWVSRRVITL